MEYNQRLSENENSAQQASQWLIEAVKQAGFDLYEKTITILESAIFHMEDAQEHIPKEWNEAPQPINKDLYSKEEEI